MTSKIFFNLAVKDLKKSIGFFTTPGFSFNTQFTDASATCIIIGENIFAMLLTKNVLKILPKNKFVTPIKITKY